MSGNTIKKQKIVHAKSQERKEMDITDTTTRVIVEFATPEGETTGPQLDIPLVSTTKDLNELINTVLNNEEKLPYSFFFDEEEIVDELHDVLEKKKAEVESVVRIIYQPQALFRVRAVTRCTDTIAGHSEAVLHVAFSPDGQQLVSGSGDKTVRTWDVWTATPNKTMRGHKNWVMAVAYSPCGTKIASGGMEGDVRVWDAKTGVQLGKEMKGHTKWITSLAWEPMISNYECYRLASSSKDKSVRIWDTRRRTLLYTLGGHSDAVKCIKWGGQGLLYTASQDRKIKVWNTEKGILVRTLEGHGHWVNTLSLNTEHVLRTGPNSHLGVRPEDEKEAMEECKNKYNKVITGTRELLASGSDDFTLFLWDPTTSKKPIARMTGHQQPVNFISFSPDGLLLASASFDNSVRLWDGRTGRFMATFRGHVQDVYQVCFSADSRLLCSSSKDSTIKVWDLKAKKLKFDLPGHSDKVFAIDWSPDGQRVCSGGKDKVLKIWRS